MKHPILSDEQTARIRLIGKRNIPALKQLLNVELCYLAADKAVLSERIRQLNAEEEAINLRLRRLELGQREHGV